MASNIILIGIMVILIAAVAALVLLHNGQQPAITPSLTTTPSVMTIRPSTTTVQTYSASPYMTQSQAQTLIGAITSQTTKVYNTSAEIAGLGGQFFGGQFTGNVTAVWIASYNNTNNQSITDLVVLSPDAQALYAKMTGSAPSYATFGAQNGMNYMFIRNTTNNNAAGEGLIGWKGDYVTMAFTSRITNITAASLSELVASDLP
jgi:hypothetical protein